jgi:hypothetical protein
MSVQRPDGAYWVWRDNAPAWELFLWYQGKWWMFGGNDYFTDTPGLIVGPMVHPPHQAPRALDRKKAN